MSSRTEIFGVEFASRYKIMESLQAMNAESLREMLNRAGIEFDSRARDAAVYAIGALVQEEFYKAAGEQVPQRIAATRARYVAQYAEVLEQLKKEAAMPKKEKKNKAVSEFAFDVAKARAMRDSAKFKDKDNKVTKMLRTLIVKPDKKTYIWDELAAVLSSVDVKHPRLGNRAVRLLRQNDVLVKRT